jgi:hypothetical protein
VFSALRNAEISSSYGNMALFRSRSDFDLLPSSLEWSLLVLLENENPEPYGSGFYQDEIPCLINYTHNHYPQTY